MNEEDQFAEKELKWIKKQFNLDKESTIDLMKFVKKI